jgi:hypothetical protein
VRHKREPIWEDIYWGIVWKDPTLSHVSPGILCCGSWSEKDARSLIIYGRKFAKAMTLKKFRVTIEPIAEEPKS